jgi:predicted MFS family arabinose efflux permease
MVSIVAVATSALVTALAPSFLPLLLAGLIGAVGRAAVVPTAQAVVGIRFEDAERRRSVSWIMTGHSGSALLGLPLLTSIAAFTNWRIALGALGVLALGIALLLYRTPMAGGGQGGVPLRLRGIVASYAPLWTQRPLAGVILSNFVGGVGAWAAFTYLGAYLAQRHGFTTTEVGWGYLAVGVGIVLGTRLVGTRLGARPRPLLIVSRVVGGVTIGAAFLVPLPALAALGLLVLGATADLVATTASAVLLVAESPESRATTMTVNQAALSLGVACGGALGGLVLALGDYPALGFVALAWLLGAAGLLVWFRPRDGGGMGGTAV